MLRAWLAGGELQDMAESIGRASGCVPDGGLGCVVGPRWCVAFFYIGEISGFPALVSVFLCMADHHVAFSHAKCSTGSAPASLCNAQGAPATHRFGAARVTTVPAVGILTPVGGAYGAGAVEVSCGAVPKRRGG